MTVSRHKHLGPLETLGQLPRLVSRDGLFQLRQVFLFFLPDVLLQVGIETLQRGDEFWVVRGELLEYVELLFDLERCMLSQLRKAP